MKKHYRHETDCLNCGADLQGHFCHVCGQENLQMKESFGHMLNHAVSDYFHFDYQFFHTLKPLFAKPGKLTVDYLAGRRMQYLHPVKMYIFISLVFFVLFFKVNGDNIVQLDKGKESGKLLKDTIQHNLLTDIDNDKNLTPEERQKAKKAVNTLLPGAVKAVPDSARISTEKKTGKKTLSDQDADTTGNFNFLGKEYGKTYPDYLSAQDKLPEEKRDGFIKRYFIKKGYDWERQGKNAGEIFREAFQHNAPKVMFLLLPLFALILKVAFSKNHKLYVEHIIYAIHLHCFIFLFLTFAILLKMLLPESWKPVADCIDIITTFTFIWYVYRSLRVVYNRTRWRTVSKMIGVSLMYWLAATFCIFVFFVITAITSV